MATILHSNNLGSLDAEQEHQAYNCLDSCVLPEIATALRPGLDRLNDDIYDFERQAQNPAFAMMVRGILVDEDERKAAIRGLKREEAANLKALLRDANANPLTWGCYTDKLPNSHLQMTQLLYEAMKLPRQYKNKKITADKDAIGKLIEKSPEHAPMLQSILDIRTAEKHRQIFESGLGPDGRMRTTNNVGAAETDRWSTGLDCFKFGASLHGIPKKLRFPFIPDPGKLMAQPDLQQAESKCIAFLAEDEAYIAAHEEGNVHVNVAVNVLWPEGLKTTDGKLIGWSNDPMENEVLCRTTPVYWDAHHTYYDKSKNNQHGLNFGLTARGVAKHAGLPSDEARWSYARYHAVYTRIKAYHRWVINEIKTKGQLVNPWGRVRQFFGRPWDAATHREGFAHLPQNITATVLNRALVEVWERFDPWELELLQQGHDSFLFQFPVTAAEVRAYEVDNVPRWRILQHVVKIMETPVEINGRKMVIPVDMSVGRNWMECS